MRWTVTGCWVVCGLLILGCDNGSGGTPTAGAGGMPPPPPSAAPPPAADPTPPPGDDNPNGTPDGGQAQPGGDAPQPDSSESPPPQSALGSPDGATPPGDPGNAGDQPGNENPDGAPRTPPPPRGLREQSFAAFRSGNDVIGFKLLNAYYAAGDKAKEELPAKMNWYPGLARPGLVPRIGIAVYYAEQPLGFKGDPMPIGSTALTSAVDQMQQAEAADGRIGGTGRKTKFGRGMRGPMADFSEGSKTAGDPMANATPETQLNHYTGDLGNWLLEALHERIEAGEYGSVIQELTQQASRTLQRAAPGEGGLGQPGGFGGAQPGYDPGEASGDASQPGGPGGGRFGGGGRRGGRGQPGAGGGQFGGSLDGIPGEEPPTGANAPRRWSTRASDKEAASLAKIKQLSPCIVWLGKVDKDEYDQLEKRAQAANLDVMAVFSMTVRTARTGNLTNTTTTLRLLTIKGGLKGVPGYMAEPLTNLDVERWRQKDEKGVDPAEREITKAIEALDRVFKAASLPDTVTAAVAKKRISFLVTQKPEEPLPVLVEARFYLTKGLISQEDFDGVARDLVGDTAFKRLLARAKDGDE